MFRVLRRVYGACTNGKFDVFWCAADRFFCIFRSKLKENNAADAKNRSWVGKLAPQAKFFWNGLEEISAAGDFFLKLGLEEINFLQYFLAKKLISSWLFEIRKVNFLPKLISSWLIFSKVNFLLKAGVINCNSAVMNVYLLITGRKNITKPENERRFSYAQGVFESGISFRGGKWILNVPEWAIFVDFQ